VTEVRAETFRAAVLEDGAADDYVRRQCGRTWRLPTRASC
jgi:hypothetical protein